MSGYLAIDPCPFYGESGGQVGDKGRLLVGDNQWVEVHDTMVPYDGAIVLSVRGDIGNVQVCVRRSGG